ncbi:STAS domain-containing protein [Rhodococcus fascians]|nr:STAS domain-containing protein [Rhodococcus fascians]
MTVSDFSDVCYATADRVDQRYRLETESYSPSLTVLRAVGELDMSARSDLVDALDKVLNRDAVVLLDLSAVDFMYSGAASVIVDAAARSCGRLEIFAPTRPARRVLTALGAELTGAAPIQR